MRLLFIGDLHIGSYTFEKERAICRRLLERAAEADMVILGGDMTNIGLPEQYDRLISLYSPLGDKCVPVRGNHDMGEFMNRIKPWIPSDANVCFELGSYPVWIWTTNWFQMLESNTKCFSFQQSLPAPYNHYAQPPVIVVQDGIGPYYSFERGGFKFIVLDSSTHRLGITQQSWLAREIGTARLPIIILMHQNILPMGSVFDNAVLWDKQPVLGHLLDNPLVLGVFGGHVHYNRSWDWKGKKIVTTAERGESRFIELKNGKITAIEPINNERCSGRRRGGDTDQAAERPLDLRHWWPDDVLTPHTFWSFSNDLWWKKDHWGWHAPEGSGGLTWSVPPELLPYEETWFGVSFRSTTPWELLIRWEGAETVVQKGAPGENLVATGSYGRNNRRPGKVILKQEAPACGHACCNLVFGETPIHKFNHYP